MVSKAFDEVFEFEDVKFNEIGDEERYLDNVGEIHRKEDPLNYKPSIRSSRALS